MIQMKRGIPGPIRRIPDASRNSVTNVNIRKITDVSLFALWHLGQATRTSHDLATLQVTSSSTAIAAGSGLGHDCNT
jgi:hypothetical protein